MSEILKIILIDDHSLFRAGLAELLSRKNIKVVASVGDGLVGLSKVEELRPDIVLLDIRMPNYSGLQILQMLNERCEDIPVIMLTTSREDKDIAEALRLGARGYLLKDMEPEELVKSLYSLAQGQTVVAPELAATLARVVQGSHKKNDTDDKLSHLTPREKEILRHLADGGSNKAIARLLDISDGTVKLHVKAILRKLEVRSRVEAAVIAVEHGLNKPKQDNIQ